MFTMCTYRCILNTRCRKYKKTTEKHGKLPMYVWQKRTILHICIYQTIVEGILGSPDLESVFHSVVEGEGHIKVTSAFKKNCIYKDKTSPTPRGLRMPTEKKHPSKFPHDQKQLEKPQFTLQIIQILIHFPPTPFPAH